MSKPNTQPYWNGPGYRGEYTCPCGVGHGNHIHGCCGLKCCTREDFPLRVGRDNRTAEQFVANLFELLKCDPYDMPEEYKEVLREYKERMEFVLDQERLTTSLETDHA